MLTPGEHNNLLATKAITKRLLCTASSLRLISPTVATAKQPLGSIHQPLWEYTFSLANSGYIMSIIIRDNTGIHFFTDITDSLPTYRLHLVS